MHTSEGYVGTSALKSRFHGQGWKNERKLELRYHEWHTLASISIIRTFYTKLGLLHYQLLNKLLIYLKLDAIWFETQEHNIPTSNFRFPSSYIISILLLNMIKHLTYPYSALNLAPYNIIRGQFRILPLNLVSTIN